MAKSYKKDIEMLYGAVNSLVRNSADKCALNWSDDSVRQLKQRIKIYNKKHRWDWFKKHPWTMAGFFGGLGLGLFLTLGLLHIADLASKTAVEIWVPILFFGSAIGLMFFYFESI